ncbi:hypothetical protein, partial [[Eubacterium] cellulosolvens]
MDSVLRNAASEAKFIAENGLGRRIWRYHYGYASMPFVRARAVSSEVLDDNALMNEALAIVERAEKEGIVLRILGALAIRLHSEEYSTLHKGLNRIGTGQVSFTDVDLVGYSSQKGKIRRLMEQSLGFLISRQF